MLQDKLLLKKQKSSRAVTGKIIIEWWDRHY